MQGSVAFYTVILKTGKLGCRAQLYVYIVLKTGIIKQFHAVTSNKSYSNYKH